jgi:hypothetical protein
VNNKAVSDKRPITCFTLSKDSEVINDISNLNNLKDIASWIENQKIKNKNLYEKTGDITNYRYSDSNINKK